MKKVWMCKWQTVPGDKEATEKFNKYGEAKAYIRDLVRKIDISELCISLKKDFDCKYTRAIADFLTNYVNDPNFPRTTDDIPSDDPKDYDDYDTYTEDDIDFLNKCVEFYCSESSISFKYYCYAFETDFVIGEPINKYDDCRFSYLNDNADLNCPNCVKDMYMTLSYDIEWGTSANPIMILIALQGTSRPMLQENIIENIFYSYGKTVERKAIGKGIELLNNLGYCINRTASGYVLDKSVMKNISNYHKFGPGANSVMVLLVLQNSTVPLKQTDIVQEMQSRFSQTIERQAVGNHINLLKALGYEINRSKEGYVLVK